MCRKSSNCWIKFLEWIRRCLHFIEYPPPAFPSNHINDGDCDDSSIGYDPPKFEYLTLIVFVSPKSVIYNHTLISDHSKKCLLLLSIWIPNIQELGVLFRNKSPDWSSALNDCRPFKLGVKIFSASSRHRCPSVQQIQQPLAATLTRKCRCPKSPQTFDQTISQDGHEWPCYNPRLLVQTISVNRVLLPNFIHNIHSTSGNAYSFPYLNERYYAQPQSHEVQIINLVLHTLQQEMVPNGFNVGVWRRTTVEQNPRFPSTCFGNWVFLKPYESSSHVVILATKENVILGLKNSPGSYCPDNWFLYWIGSWRGSDLFLWWEADFQLLLLKKWGCRVQSSLCLIELYS